MEEGVFSKFLATETTMNNKYCSSEDIFNLNHSKEYVLLAQNILELVVTDTRLNAQTAKLWQLLYAKAKFNHELAITVPYKELGEILHKSTRTIIRYVEVLEDCGYLKTTSNFDSKGSRLANTLFVRLPTETLKGLYNQKDRKKAACPNIEGFIENVKSDTSPPDSTVTSINIINKINKNNNTRDVVDINLPKEEELETAKMFHVEQSCSNQNAVKPETHNQEETPATLKPLQQKINLAEKSFEGLNKIFLANNSVENFLAMREAEEFLHSMRLHYQNQLRQIQKAEAATNKQTALNTDENLMLGKEGARPFTCFEINRLKRGLQGLCKAEKYPTLLNEITYAVRFGDLRKQQKSGQELSIHHAISIALKLVRERRWETPKGLW